MPVVLASMKLPQDGKLQASLGYKCSQETKGTELTQEVSNSPYSALKLILSCLLSYKVASSILFTAAARLAPEGRTTTCLLFIQILSFQST